MVERLDWDSDFFEYEIGKIIVSDNCFFDYNSFLNDSKKYKLVYIFSDKELDKNKFILVDKKVVFSKKISTNFDFIDNVDNLKFCFFNEEIHSYNELKSLAIESGVFSRFKIDKNFNNHEFEKLYERWIFTSANDKEKTDIIIVTNFNNEILGFVTLKKISNELASIGLVAVSSKTRGKRIGTKLMMKTLSHAVKKGFKEIKVVTQQDNYPAMKLYESINFKIENITYIYHHWNL